MHGRGSTAMRRVARRAHGTPDRRAAASGAGAHASSAWASSAAASSTCRPTSTSCSPIPRTARRDGARSPIANAEFFERLGRARHRRAARSHGRGLRLPRRHAAASLRRQRARCARRSPALEQYLVTQGRAWERYAWLKARPLTGDASRRARRASSSPFVYRKYLDYDAYEGLRGIHRQIRAQERREDYGRDIKLGPRRHPRDRVRRAGAADRARRPRAVAARARHARGAARRSRHAACSRRSRGASCSDAYAFLRDLEHRLQYRDDQQTQRLPDDAERAARCWRRRCDLPGAARIRARARRDVRRDVEAQFDAVFGAARARRTTAASPSSAAWDETTATPALATPTRSPQAGYDDRGDALLAALAQVRDEHALPPAAGAVAPALRRAGAPAARRRRARARSRTRRRSVVFERLLALLEAVSRRSAYLALLIEHPPLLPRLAQLMGASAWAADYLTQHPMLLDELLDARALLAEPDWRRVAAASSRASWPCTRGDAERQMDALRHFRHAQTLRLLAQDLAGRLTRRAACRPPVRARRRRARRRRCANAGGSSARRADVAAAAALRGHRATAGWAARSSATRRTSTSCSSTTSMPTTADADSAGDRYARLAQRINTWLTSTTAGGPALRHRPAPASRRRGGLHGVEPRGVSPLPARAGVDVGAPGAHARALRRGRRRAGRGVRGRAHRDPAPAARRRQRLADDIVGDAPAHGGRAPEPARRCSTSSTTQAAWSTSSSSCSTWCWRTRTRIRS